MSDSSEVSAIVAQHISALETRVRETARRSAVEDMNSVARRIRSAENRDDAIRVLVDATAAFCGAAALFSVQPDALKFEAARGLESPSDVEFVLTPARAFRSAIESRDVVVAAVTSGELSPPVASLFGEGRLYLVPVVLRDKTIAVLGCTSEEASPDVNGLELLAALAASHLEIPARLAAPLVSITRGREIAARPTRPEWSDLSRTDQQIHLRAQRFARTRVAGLLLHHIEKVRQARADGDIYGTFREEIDGARNEFRRDFFDPCASMVDYLHLELVRTLAREESAALGPDYPGSLLH